MEYDVTYEMEDGTLCHVGSGKTVREAICDALWVIDYDGLTDAETITVRKEDGTPVLSVDVTKITCDEDVEEIIIEAVEKRIAQLDKPRRETGKYQIIPCNENGAVDITQKTEGFDTIEDFKAGIREWASSGWTFCGLHPWHMGANLDQIYVKKVA